MTRLLRPLVLTATLLAPTAAAGMTVDEALRRSMLHHPTLCAARHQVATAEARAAAQAASRPLTLGADAMARHERSPTLAVGGVTTPTTDAVALGVDLSQTLPWGTRLEARVEAGYQRITLPVAPGASDQLELGPGMSLRARVGVEQPLLKGAGTAVGEAEGRARQHEATSARRTQSQRRREVLREVLMAYYELWYAQEALTIERRALALAKAELVAARERVDEGTSPLSEVTSVSAQVAERREAVAAAELTQRERSIALGTRVGAMKRSHFVASDAPPEPPLMGRRSRRDTVRRSLARSHALAALSAQRKAAQQRLTLARDIGRPRLDLTGWVQTQGLGYRSVRPAVSQFGTFGAVSAQVGLRFEAPASTARRDAETTAAQAEVDRIGAEERALRHRLASEVRTLVARAHAARQRLRLARQTVRAAREQLNAARARHQEGDAVMLEVARAIEALRRAELRARRWQTQWALSDIALRSRTGELLTGRRMPSTRCSG